MARSCLKALQTSCGVPKKFVLPPLCLVEPSISYLGDSVREEWIERDLKAFVAYLNNVDVG
jgi:hypothetical protein